MKIVPVSTHPITAKDNDILKIIEKYIKKIKENSILVITSKIISISEGNIISKENIDKEELIKKESEYYIPSSTSKYKITLTIKNGILVSSAGIDESNGNGSYILWPKDPQKTANLIRKFLKQKFKVKKVGVIIIDSRSTPFRRGAIGLGLAISGFVPLNNYINKQDIFGKILKVTKSSVIDNLASAAVLVMGEGKESTPLALASEIQLVKFVERNPTNVELKELKINLEDDLFSALFRKDLWKKGQSS